MFPRSFGRPSNAPSHRLLRTISLPLMAVLIGTLAVAPNLRVQAASFEVNSIADQHDATPGDGVCDVDATTAGHQCTLRAAVEEAAALGGGLHTVTLSAGTYPVDLGTLSITNTLALIGNGNPLLRASGDFPTLSVRINGSAQVTGITLTHAEPASGAGLRNEGSTTLVNVTIVNNGSRNTDLSTNTQAAGGIDNVGTLSITGSTISTNRAYQGGGILQKGASATLTVTSSSLSNNISYQGGGLGISGGTAVVSNTTIHQNVAQDNAGGIGIRNATAALTNVVVSSNTAASAGGIGLDIGANVSMTGSQVINNRATGSAGGTGILSGATLLVVGSQISGNSAGLDSGGSAQTGGNVTLTETTVAGNTAGTDAGGLGASGGTLTIRNSTISGNTANDRAGGIGLSLSAVLNLSESTVSGNVATRFDGGGLGLEHPSSIARLTNVTVSTNQAGRNGGGIATGGPLSLNNSTIAGNLAKFRSQGAGIYTNPPGTTTIRNSILMNMPTQSTEGNCAGIGTVTSLGHNLSSDSTCILSGEGDLLSVNPLLGPLADNGGDWHLRTHALLPGSPAIDAGDNAACPAIDQRGFPRPTDGNNDGTTACDIGAVEGTLVTPKGTPTPSVIPATTTTPTTTVTISASATRTPSTSPSPSRTPTVTPTAVLGGRGLTLVANPDSRVQLRWQSGAQQTGYLVIRWAPPSTYAFLPRFDQLLPGATTTYADPDPLPNEVYCYILLVVGDTPPSINDARGFSDLLCVYPRSVQAVAPQQFALRLSESTQASLSWTGPGGQDHYDVTVRRFDGSAPAQYTLGPTETEYIHETDGATTCYQLRAMAGTKELGRTDELCGAPGVSTLAAQRGLNSALRQVRGRMEGQRP